ncbi:hypothetical protein ASPZODRAFT_1220457 [Penicilliopsis zonata CBS 506.65]|uniref:Altered inheritance of mitochondria protein 13, mitochondrial n=1 Tax=Penicilliopsis zonata CBS 506.65 TaxID=1073090 RepID=A0A1L9S7I4_9EURO|nr:hypothetical protein ASPZODRAFT_1220457 [Penicilliopsis zonata CBS 506.65]OJJ43120.1 hypothetical protein ASPZODRAFT_1220457 [Penicilliopsis zonata CBS 506.65]
MGAGSSKTQETAGSHVFSSSSPIQFSAGLVDNLQASTETDSSRAKSIELQIQARVAQELERLRAREQQTLAEIEKRIAEAKDTKAPSSSSSPSSTTSSSTTSYPAGSLDLDAPRIPFAGRDSTPSSSFFSAEQPTAEPASTPIVNRDISRDSVMSEIDQLRSKLEGRRKLTELDEGVARAKNQVVSCLRLHDRRPLDCWKEVEDFKREVSRLEEAFVDRVVG